jgi:uncharacterized protein YjbI with pentapeptide repeats
VAFQVGSFRKSLVVLGDRLWKAGFLGSSASEPAPFTSVRMGYENSFGGPGFPANPTGKGHGTTVQGKGSAHWLPNIESPDRLARDPTTAREPAGFGPIPRTWPQRARNLGSCKGSYLKERWPWYPADFDWAYFNAAPPDQRLEGYLRGDEILRLENLHPAHGVYDCRFPGDRPQLFIVEAASIRPDGSLAALPREVPLKLDTLWVDMDCEKAVLVWRGLARVADLKLKDLAEAHLVAGSLSSPPLTPGGLAAERERRALEAREAEEREAAEEKAEEEASLAEEASFLAEVAALEKQLEEHLQAQRLDLVESLKQAGGDASLLDLAATPADPESLTAQALAHLSRELGQVPKEVEDAVAKERELLASADEASRSAGEPWTRARCEEEARARGSFEDQDLSGLDLSGLDLSGLSFERASLARAKLKGCLLKGASLREADLSEADLTLADLSGADLEEAMASKGIFDGATFAGTSLARAWMPEASFRGVDLSGVAAREADFSKAELTGVSFRDGLLDDADFTSARLARADFTGASLQSATLCESVLTDAKFERTSGRIADFKGADLSRAVFRESRLVQPDFTGCLLTAADFSSAVMPDATFHEAIAPDIVMVRSHMKGLRATKAKDLSRGDFRQLSAPKSIWDGALLDGARFQFAALSGASFSGAILKGVVFDAADLSRATFDEADLERASLVHAKVLRGSFERANLRRADLRRANLFEAEVWDAKIEEALLEGSNRKMTKLACE